MGIRDIDTIVVDATARVDTIVEIVVVSVKVSLTWWSWGRRWESAVVGTVVVHVAIVERRVAHLSLLRVGLFGHKCGRVHTLHDSGIGRIKATTTRDPTSSSPEVVVVAVVTLGPRLFGSRPLVRGHGGP